MVNVNKSLKVHSNFNACLSKPYYKEKLFCFIYKIQCTGIFVKMFTAEMSCTFVLRIVSALNSSGSKKQLHLHFNMQAPLKNRKSAKKCEDNLILMKRFLGHSLVKYEGKRL